MRHDKHLRGDFRRTCVQTTIHTIREGLRRQTTKPHPLHRLTLHTTNRSPPNFATKQTATNMAGRPINVGAASRFCNHFLLGVDEDD
jgi:hypothetical protein